MYRFWFNDGRLLNGNNNNVYFYQDQTPAAS